MRVSTGTGGLGPPGSLGGLPEVVQNGPDRQRRGAEDGKGKGLAMDPECELVRECRRGPCPEGGHLLNPRLPVREEALESLRRGLERGTVGW